jgi:hypothetical protein
MASLDAINVPGTEHVEFTGWSDLLDWLCTLAEQDHPHVAAHAHQDDMLRHLMAACSAAKEVERIKQRSQANNA